MVGFQLDETTATSHRDIFLFKSYVCLGFSKIAPLKRRVISQPPRALSQFRHSFSTVFIFAMILIINPRWYMLNSDASLLDLQVGSVWSHTTQAPHSRVQGVCGEAGMRKTASLLNLLPLAVTFPQTRREKEKQGRIFSLLRALQIPLGDHT